MLEFVFCFVGEQYQYDVAYRVQGLCRSLKKIIIFDPEVKRAEGDNNSIYFSDFLQMGEKEECQPEVDKRFLSLLWMIWRIFCTLLVRQVIQKG